MLNKKSMARPPRKGDRVRFTSGNLEGKLGTVAAVVDMAPGQSWHVRVDGSSYDLPGNGPDNIERVAS